MHDDMTEIAILTLTKMCCTCTLDCVEMLRLILDLNMKDIYSFWKCRKISII